MTRITKPLRGRAPVKRMDLSDMRSLFADRRVWAGIGIVYAPEGEEHWQIVQNDSGDSVDILVEVVLQPSEEEITCRLPAGVWDVPDEGDEVGVIIPDGATDFMPLIVCRLSTNSVPTTQGPQPGHIVIVRDQVLVHDGNGGAVELLKRSEFIDHAHATAATGPPSVPQRIAGDPEAIPPIAPLATGIVGFPGTSVLKGK